jgi:hypothetical protein
MAKRNDPIINVARNITGKMLTGNTAKETARVMNYINNQMYGG